MQIIVHNFIKNIILPYPCDPCGPCSLFYSNTDFHGVSRNICSTASVQSVRSAQFTHLHPCSSVCFRVRF